MDTSTSSSDFFPWWLPVAIIGGFVVFFPALWCGIVWIMSRAGGWNRLAARYPAGTRAPEGEECRRVFGMVGMARYKGILKLHFARDGFFMEVMPIFKIGHPPLFIPWAEVVDRKPFQLLWFRTVRLTIGSPAAGTITLPADLVEKHQPGGRM
ncbi:MAG: hypothetical protein K1X78_05385 [Verrucomicrobiaceae bacterium]|nr:hypothetical protein [Verrucomicrobiaceae bacterium]